MLNKNVTVILKEDGGSPSTLKKKKKKEEEKAVAVIKDDTPASRLREGDHEVVEGVGNRAASNTGNTSPISTKSDHSSPTAAWRNPETFQAIPWSDYEGLNKYDRRAYLKAYAENSQREKAQRDAIAQAEARRINQEKSDKMLADHFYGRMLKGEQIDVSNFDAKTLQNLQQRAYEDYSNGNLSTEKYLLMPIHNFESLDNRQAKVYNGNIDNPTQPLMQTSGFDRYRTERYDYVPANYVGNKKPSSENNGNLIKYDRDAAAAYGIEYGEGYNFPEYMPMNNWWFRQYHKYIHGSDTGSDCANFVSQCLVAGGIEMDNMWHYYHQANMPLEAAYQPDNPFIKYYYDSDGKTTLLTHDYDFTPIWAVVTPQFEYFSDPKNGYTSKPPVVITSPDDLADAISKYNIQKGDLLYWSKDGGETLYHSTIISNVVGNEIKYAGHSNFASENDLYDKMVKNGETVVIVRMNDYIRK